MSEPAIRAAVTKDYIEALDAVAPGLRERVLAQVPREALAAIDAVIRIGWLPLGHHLAVNEATRKLTGLAEYQLAWRHGMTRTFDQPILRPVVQSGIRLFGLTPMTFIRLTPKAWGLLLRDAGEVSVDEGSGEGPARVEVHDMPGTVLASDTFFLGLVGVFSAFFEITKTTGDVRLREHELARGRAVYEIAWKR